MQETCSGDCNFGILKVKTVLTLNTKDREHCNYIGGLVLTIFLTLCVVHCMLLIWIDSGALLLVTDSEVNTR